MQQPDRTNMYLMLCIKHTLFVLLSCLLFMFIVTLFKRATIANFCLHSM